MTKKMTKKEMIAAAREATLRAWRGCLNSSQSHDQRLITDAQWGGALDVLKAMGACDFCDSEHTTPGLISFHDEECL